MRLYFIKDYKLPDGRVIKAGKDATLWDATDALKTKSAVPYDQRQGYEPQTEAKTTPQSAGQDPTVKAKAVKKSKT